MCDLIWTQQGYNIKFYFHELKKKNRRNKTKKKTEQNFRKLKDITKLWLKGWGGECLEEIHILKRGAMGQWTWMGLEVRSRFKLCILLFNM